MKIKLLLMTVLSVVSILSNHLHVHAEVMTQQRKDIESLLSEIDYLIETTQQMQKEYQKDTSKVRFNYVALLQQLRTAKIGIKEYLNLDITELHDAPIPPVQTQMIK